MPTGVLIQSNKNMNTDPDFCSSIVLRNSILLASKLNILSFLHAKSRDFTVVSFFVKKLIVVTKSFKNKIFFPSDP
jgi:hypothetical protein